MNLLFLGRLLNKILTTYEYFIMKNLLFPQMFKSIGWCLFIPSLILGILRYFDLFDWSHIVQNIINDVVIIGIALGAIFIVCSKEPCEDEMTRAIRLASLLNTLYIYVALLITNTLFLYGEAFYHFMILNLVLLPIIYVVIFRLEMLRYNKMSEDEEQD